MATVAQALTELGITEWVLRGEPTSSAEFKEMFRKVTGEDENGSAIESADSADWGVTWTQVNNKLKQLNAAEPMKALRVERDRRLAETDWWGLQDVNSSEARHAYRQALRDITDTATSLDDVVWPDKPE